MAVPRSPDTSVALTAPLRDGALEVLKTLRGAGFEAFFAGGCVRDQVLGIAPKDWDVATSARPEEVLGLFAKAIPVGIQFGVVRVIVQGHEYEVATFRADGDYEDHRRPTSVRWASAREDVLRRDFTINGLLGDPVDGEESAAAPLETFGGMRVVDFVGGLDDLRLGLIRAIGVPEQRFEEDYLRLLRAVRFSARFGFEVDADTFAATRMLASRIVHVSAERIGNELDRLLSEGGQARGVRLLAETGLLPQLLPELESIGSFDLGPTALEAHEFPTNFTNLLERLARLGRCEPVMGWGVLLWDCADHVPIIAERLRMSRAMGRDLVELIAAGQRVVRWNGLTIADKKRLLRLSMGPRAVVLASIAGFREASSLARKALAEWTNPQDLSPTPLINGADLKTLGFPPGPGFREALFAVETEQLEGRITTRDAALELAHSILSTTPSTARRSHGDS